MSADAKDAFFEEHGDHVLLDGFYLFADGATAENTAYGRLAPPPVDSYELAALQLRYAQVVAEQAEQQFLSFKSYLQGHGKREPFWATLHTEQQQLAHLKTLRQQAMRMRAKLSRAKRAVKDETPAWIAEREQADAEQAARQQRFADQVEEIEL